MTVGVASDAGDPLLDAAAGDLLDLRAFGFAYDQQVVVREIDLRLHPRARLTLIGPAGAGKSSSSPGSASTRSGSGSTTSRSRSRPRSSPARALPAPSEESVSRLRWAQPGVLAGSPRPGLLDEDAAADLAAVAAGGILDLSNHRSLQPDNQSSHLRSH